MYVLVTFVECVSWCSIKTKPKGVVEFITILDGDMASYVVKWITYFLDCPDERDESARAHIHLFFI